MFDDLDPYAGGTVSWKQLADRAVVTWEDVPEYGKSNSNTLQIEMLFDGRLRLSWLAVAAQDGAVGLSNGGDVPSDFKESDLSRYIDCSVDLGDIGSFASHWLDTGCDDAAGDESDWCFGTDINEDGSVDFYDYADLAMRWLVDIYN